VSYSRLLGGAERLLLDVAEGLDGELGLACPPGPLEEAARRGGLRTVSLRPRRLELRQSLRDRLLAPARIAAQALELRPLVRAVRPSVVVAWNMRPLLSCALALAPERPRPALVFQHNDMLPGPIVARAIRAAARRADRVLCVSRAVAEELDPHRRLDGRIEVVHPGVDLARFAPTPPPGGEAPELLLLGALVPWKRPGLALEAVALVARRLSGVRLTIAGSPLDEGGERLLAALRERAARRDLRGRVAFAGQLPEPGPALARAWCLLHCAEREPFGMALVEALAAGRPVVAPAAGGALEIVDESCGRLYPPGDVEAAAAALWELLADPAKAARLGAAGRERAVRLFSLDDARRRYREALERVG
jgi:glycosyltransferase involved in cell wall biosynthesis